MVGYIIVIWAIGERVASQFYRKNQSRNIPSANKALKFALADLSQAFEEAKAHSFAKPGLAKAQERLEYENVIRNFV